MDDVVEIWNAVLARASRVGESALSEEEAGVYRANRERKARITGSPPHTGKKKVKR